MEYKAITNPVWTDASHSMIAIQIVFPSIGQTPLKFVASPNDVMGYGREIYADLIAGKYGAIAEATQ
jgi:hypothetical protein